MKTINFQRIIWGFIWIFLTGSMTSFAQNQTISPQSDLSNEKRFRLKWDCKEGQVYRAVQTTRFKVNLMIASETEQPRNDQTELTTRVEFTDRVLEVRDGIPLRILRRVDSSVMDYKDLVSGETLSNPLPMTDAEAEMLIREDGSMEITNVIQGDQEAQAMLAESSRWFSLLPETEVQLGDVWSLEDEKLQKVLSALKCTDGSLSIRFLNRTQSEPFSEIITLSGELKSIMDLGDGLKGNFTGNLTEHFGMSSGQPLMRELTGTAEINQTQSFEGGTVRFTGNVEMHAKEEKTFINSAPPTAESTPTPSNVSEQPVDSELR